MAKLKHFIGPDLKYPRIMEALTGDWRGSLILFYNPTSGVIVGGNKLLGMGYLDEDETINDATKWKQFSGSITLEQE